MISDNKDMCKQLKESFEKFDLPQALEAIKQLSAEEVKATFAAKFKKPGAFQIRGDRKKRNNFYDSLLGSSFMQGQPEEVRDYTLNLDRKVRLIERCFDETRSTLPKCDISTFPLDIQFWSHVERASRELRGLRDAGHQKMESLLQAAEAGTPFSIPEMAMVTLPDGNEVNLDAVYSSIISTLSLTLKMLAFENKLLSGGKLIAPSASVVSDDHIHKAGAIQLFAVTWNSLEDIANRTLFFDGEITSPEEAGFLPGDLPEGFYKKFADPLVFNRIPSEIEICDFLANRRLHSWFVQTTYRLQQGLSEPIHVMAKGGAIPGLSGGPFISEEEAIALVAIAEILSFDVFSDQERYHKLTIREWVRGYCALKQIAQSKQANSCLVTLDKAELEKGFLDYQIPSDRVSSLIHHLTFGQESHDLFDTPLIRTQDDKYSLLADVVTTCNIPNVLFSRLSSLETQFKKKGKGFENKVLSFFQSKQYQCKPANFTIDKAQYEYDALLLLDDTLFLFECKNKTLSGNHAVQVLRYSDFIDETVEQVKRLELGLQGRPEIVESLFGRKLTELNVVPVILNSMNYSRPPIDQVYVSDFSALSKFFNENAISEFHWENGEKKVRKVIRRLWSGDKPTSQELLEYLTMPPQLELISDHLTHTYYPRLTSENTIFFSAILDVDEPAMQLAKQEAPSVA